MKESSKPNLVMICVLALLSFSIIPNVNVMAQGEPEFTEASSGLPSEGDYSNIKLADMNKDGKMDIISGADAYGDVDTHGLYVWTGNGAGSWSKVNNGLPDTHNFGGIGVGDLNKDGNPDLAAGYETWSGSEGLGVGIWLGNGGSGGLKFNEGTKPIDNGGYDSAGIADVDQDGNLDVLGASRGKGIKIWLGNGASTLSWTEASLGLPTSGEYTGIAAADIDEDGDLDIAAGNYGGNGIQVWTRNADGSWTEASDGLWDKDNSFCTVFADFNKDGDLDLASTVRDHGIFVWTGNGGAGGSVQWTEDRQGLPVSGRYKQIDVADFDGDGNLDIVAARPNGGIYVWRSNGGDGGSMMFSAASGNLPTDGTFYGASFGKVDPDAVLDVVGATWDSGIKAWTTSLGPADTTPPSAVTDLAAAAQNHQSVKLTWKAPGDDGTTGKASSYDIRYSSSDITDMTDFEAAFKAEGEPTPKDAGASENFVLKGLSANRTYHFALVTYDDSLNPSSLSNVATATTPEAPTNPNPPTVAIEDPPEGSTIKGTVQVTITFSDLDNDVNEMEIFLDGDKVESRSEISSPQMWEWNTKSGDHKVKNGDHTIKVTVTDGGGHTATSEVTYDVKNAVKDEPKGFIPGFGAVLVSVALIVVILVRRRA